MKRVYFIVFYLIITSSLCAQIVDGEFKTIINVPTYEVTVAAKMKSGTGSAGVVSIEFSYNTAALSFPNTPDSGTDYFLQGDFASYTTKNITRSATNRIRISLITTGSPAPVPLDTAYRDIIKLYLTITNTTDHSNLTWVQTSIASTFLAPNYTVGNWPNLDDTPLPVELISITANIIQENNVELKWGTATELNNNGFEVERIIAGSAEWKKICFIKGIGNSESTQRYNYIDRNIIGGSKFQYRLKQIDFDGSYQYSSSVEVEIVPEFYSLSQNYPNPFNPTTRIDYQLPFDSKVSIELYGITGERIATLINEELAAGYYTAEVNADMLNLASGVYICRMIAQNQNTQKAKTFIQIKKLMLIK